VKRNISGRRKMDLGISAKLRKSLINAETDKLWTGEGETTKTLFRLVLSFSRKYAFI
jgi:hypothetical protein